MVEKERKRDYNWFLDKSQENIIFIRFVFAADGKSLEEFSISYCAFFEEQPTEIIRYDCSKREEVHIHQFYRKPVEKRIVDKSKSFETMDELVKNIQKNWRLYRLKFLEK